VEVTPVGVDDIGVIERAVEAFARSANGGLIVTAAPFSTVTRDLIITLAAQHQLPAVHSLPYFARSGGNPMRYKPKGTAALHIALGGLPDKMRVDSDPDVGVSVRTVGELRKVTTWPENLVITTPQERYPESAIKISKVSVTTRYPPKH
jgi:hypothetical protein